MHGMMNEYTPPLPTRVRALHIFDTRTENTLTLSSLVDSAELRLYYAHY